MQSSYGRDRIWTTNNGFLAEHQRPPTSGNLSVHSTVSSHEGALPSQASGNGAVHRRGPAAKLLPGYNPHLIGVQSKFRRKYYYKAVLAALVLLVVVLLIVVIVLSVHNIAAIEVCNSKECVRTAATLVYSMDEAIDPCEDFYQFTCGRWAEDHPRPDSATSNDWFRERQGKVMRTLREFLRTNISEADPAAVTMTKQMYRACMNTELLDKRDLEPLVYYLRKLKVPLLPSGLNVTLSRESAAKYDDGKDFDWLQSLVLVKRHLAMDVIIGFDIFPDPLNRTVNRIALGTPETDSALPFNNDDMHKLMRKIRRKTIFNQDEEDNNEEREEEQEEESAKKTTAGLSAYVEYIRKIVEMYIEYLDADANVDDVKESLSEMTINAVKVARKIYKLKDEAENSTKSSQNPMEDLVYISIADLQNETDKLIAPKSLPIWRQYLETLMEGANHSQKFNVAELKIITSRADIVYLQMLTEYLQQVPPAHVEFYIWLSTVEELVLHTTSEMRLLHSEYIRLVIGTEGGSPRSLYCAHCVNSLMGMAVSYALADDDFTQHKLPRVRRMLSDIRHSFDALVRSTSWMDAATKHETLQKSAEMRSFIGFPDWITNGTALSAYYAGVEANASTHLENMVGVLHWQMQAKLDDLYRPEAIGWATSPSNVNAFHTFQANAITIPIAILQYPFYDLGLEALNYGSIGTILGHELTHGFDDSGRMFDKNGNMLQWWSNETIKEYVNRTECFIDQYSHYYLADVDEYIDGELTLGENIADNGGMREAFYAYRRYVRAAGKERAKLPGLEHYTNEQLFFISFGTLWCESYTPAASRYALEDSHCPGKVRLKGVLSNSAEFASAFKCPKGSGMNPKGPKCRIW